MITRRLLAVLGMVAIAGCASTKRINIDGEKETSVLKKVATFEHQVTGVAVSKDERIFVNFPRWTEDAPVSVAEVMKDGSIKAFPNEEWNRWRNAKKAQATPNDHWVCVQSVVCDPSGALWVVDPAAPGNGPVVRGGAKLVKIDLKTNSVAKTIAFDETVAIPSSYLNDVRFSPDSKWAYLTDSGAPGALIVVDTESGKAKRVLSGHPSTGVEKGVVVHTDGKELRRPDGRTAEFAADGIAITTDGKFLYWQALTGKTLYRLPTDALQDAGLSNDALAAKIEKVGTNGVSDGLLIDSKGRMFISALEQDAIMRRELSPLGEPGIILRDKRLRWPDSFAEGANGQIYVTTSRIQDMPYYKPKSGPRLETTLWVFPANVMQDR